MLSAAESPKVTFEEFVKASPLFMFIEPAGEVISVV